MPRLVRNSFAGKLEKWAERLFYVGFTRATKWLYLSGIRGSMMPELERVRKLADEAPPVITIQRERPAESEPVGATPDNDGFDVF
jgi:ATP-dependent exoDNAse (exonuclease V) beta subunit